jgi:pimeloyl-ACP methyl ester carboxylesterase
VSKLTSKDGSVIAFEKTGEGPALILVDGALCYRSFGPMGPLVPLLSPHFSVVTYDRRGRGESSDTKPYQVEREVEDIQALIDAVGGSTYVFGISSGAALALEAANRGNGIKKLALYEAPFIVDDTRTPIPDGYLAQLNSLVASNRRGDAVRLFMKLVGVPAVVIQLMRFMPAWSKSPAWMRNGMHALAKALPNAKLRTLEGQTHMVKPKVLAPTLVEFFAD